jgi:hypothetical protein
MPARVIVFPVGCTPISSPRWGPLAVNRSTTVSPSQRSETCQHQCRCPPADAFEHEAANVVAAHPDQGSSPLCNGLVLFDDGEDLRPEALARSAQPCSRHRPSPLARRCTAAYAPEPSTNVNTNSSAQ